MVIHIDAPARAGSRVGHPRGTHNSLNRTMSSLNRTMGLPERRRIDWLTTAGSVKRGHEPGTRLT
jgi:hypothetical protein